MGRSRITKFILTMAPGLLPAVITLTVAPSSHAEHRIAFAPSLTVSEVADDNLNFSVDAPLRDHIYRLTPALALRFDSPRCAARASYSMDSERFEAHSAFDDAHARDRGQLEVQYNAGPRLSFLFAASYVNTNTLEELNADSGLGASRVRARQLNVTPRMRYNFSPRVWASAGASSITTRVVNGVGINAQSEELALGRQVTPRDLFRTDVEHSHLIFHGETVSSLDTSVVLAGWTRNLTPRTHVTVQAGPRLANHQTTADIAASLTHSAQFTSFGLSLLRSRTTVIGYAGLVETQSVQGRFAYAPGRRLLAFAAPSVMRNVRGSLEAVVYRMAVGARYDLARVAGIEVTYNVDRQSGAIDSLRAKADFSRSMLFVGLTTRWSSDARYGD